MNLFYSEQITEDLITLSGEEHQHCTKVLRKSDGIIWITDGKGKLFKTEQVLKDRHHSQYRILQTNTNQAVYSHIHIGVSPTKNISRFEWCLEKLVELGILHIHPFISEHSERDKLRYDRLEKIMLSAMKQSLQTHKPILYPLMDFRSLLVDSPKKKFLAYVPERETSIVSYQDECILFIGPEGGFSQEEIDYVQGKIQMVSLGKTRLRTETAAIVGASLLRGV